MKPMKFGIGQSIKRIEDAKFITGVGRYTADLVRPGGLVAGFYRSPHAHARFTLGDLAAVRDMPGVKLVLEADDISHLGGLPCLAPMTDTDGTEMVLPPYPLLAQNTVRHVGDAIVMIVASSEAELRDAIEAVPIDFDMLDAVVDMPAAIASGAVPVWPEVGGNVAYDNAMGDKAATDAAFAAAAHVVSLTVENNRLVANFMEPRAALAEIDPDGRYVLTTGSQGVHGLRDTLAETILKVAPDKVRVVTPDVGGGFGTKTFMYREYPLLLEAALRCGAPVSWVADRTEHFLGDAQGRDNLTTAEMALDAEGRFLALRIDILGNLGAYLSQFGPYIPWLGVTMATGAYDIPVIHVRCRGVYTHTVPVDAYRGAGRPEAAYVLERLVDTCARELEIPREALRAMNFVPSQKMPYKTQTDRTYDVGDFEGAMRQALDRADAAGIEARVAEAKARGKLRGLGFASYIECTAWGEGEDGSVSLEPDGTFTVLVGTQSNGQGHATAYAQTASQYLDVPLDQIRVVQGDTDRVKTGHGTGGSRSIPVGSVMVAGASEKLVGQLKTLAAEKLEAAIADLEVGDGGIRVAGTDRAISYADLALLPGATEAVRGARDEFVPPQATYPNGTHVCEVEIDPDTGITTVERYTVCDDFGVTLNPILLAGQVHGGIAQGIGQALLERTVYGDNGQLLTATLMDYCLPRATDVPMIDFQTRNIPSTTNPLGLKGAGEAGTIGACPAVMNAVVDALDRARGIRHIDMPATPSRVAAALRAA
ncbi:xanthine dehydrogenase family protein molybdopterin-binding subunit [Lichenifustis flavocetrariae]|uniref:Xanthine dehydrogenase family protein molybdopterin-binding subunit n=1 Tax=Lichenifustis flavocetrariae TaxID=2949735 RepID=A0AA41YY74_9HYPH|nr:xanthine dehydrogenase family protein molybdopterin-binding subunit [Lichenifustis flavocetrariae]MCW6510761.1 xanthine dehydrogenase family protein molybdopterin-binding subunit [Lichenifustis flavocetrariae]